MRRILGLVGVVVWVVGLCSALVWGPLSGKPQVIKETTNRYYRRFDLDHLRTDLRKYPKLNRATLRETYVVPDLNAAQTLELRGKQTTNKVITEHFMTPQGVAITPRYVITSAYDHTYRGASILSVIDRTTGKHVKDIILQGHPHVGGITYDPDHKLLWVAGNSGFKAALIAIKMSAINQYHLSTNHAPIQYDHVTTLQGIARASTVQYYQGQLWVGFFAVTGDSTVDRFSAESVLSNTTGLNRHAGQGGLFHTIAGAWLSQRSIGEIQGLAFHGDYIYLSQSYGPEDSKIYVYKINNHRVRFTPREAVAVIRMPSHLEQITIVDSKMYTIFESGARAYAAHEHTRIGRVVEFNIKKLPHFDKEVPK